MTIVRIGTRSSPMAIAQADRVSALLRRQPGVEVQIVDFTTSGDLWTGPLHALGGKGVWTRELDRAQADGEFEIGVHCLKDIPGDVALPAGLMIAAYLPRDDVREAVISRHGAGLDALPVGAVVGTSSVRRRAQLARTWPHLTVEPIRGNANTRLAKLDDGGYDALILAACGLERIGAADRITAIIEPDLMLPAIGSGILAITTRTDDVVSRDLLAALADPDTTAQAAAERAMLAALNGNCHSPIAGLATRVGGDLQLRGAVYSTDGDELLAAEASASSNSDPSELGALVADLLLGKGAGRLIAEASM